MTDQAEIDHLLHYLPIVIRDGALTEWERSFCASIIARSRRVAFRPTPAQVRTMRRLVDGFRRRQIDLARAERDGGPDAGRVIE